MPIAFSDKAVEHAPWSMTKISTATDCGLRFTSKYVKKLKEARTVAPEARVGSAAHKAMELVLKGQPAKHAFTVGAVDNKLTTKEVEDLMCYHHNIQKFTQRIEVFKSKRPVVEQHAELEFGLSRDFQRTKFYASDVFVRGVWDFALKLESNDLIIIDHKSGPPAEDIKKHENQLNFYALAGLKLYPGIKGVQSAIHFLKDGSIVWGDYQTAEEIENKIVPWFIKYLNDSVASLTEEPKVGWYCDYCGYAGQCPAKQGKK